MENNANTGAGGRHDDDTRPIAGSEPERSPVLPRDDRHDTDREQEEINDTPKRGDLPWIDDGFGEGRGETPPPGEGFGDVGRSEIPPNGDDEGRY